MTDRVLAMLVGKLKREVENKTAVDVGKGTEELYGVSQYKFKEALKALRAVGYQTHIVRASQKNAPQSQKNFMILTKPDVPWSDAFEILKKSHEHPTN